MLRKVPCAFRVCVERSSGFNLLSVDSGDLSWGATGCDISNWGLGFPYTPPGGQGQSVISADGDMAQTHGSSLISAYTQLLLVSLSKAAQTSGSSPGSFASPQGEKQIWQPKLFFSLFDAFLSTHSSWGPKAQRMITSHALGYMRGSEVNSSIVRGVK